MNAVLTDVTASGAHVPAIWRLEGANGLQADEPALAGAGPFPGRPRGRLIEVTNNGCDRIDDDRRILESHSGRFRSLIE